MRKSKGRKTGKAAKKDDAQNGEPEVDSNEVDDGNDEEDSISNKKKTKSSKRSSSRSNEAKNYNEDEADESNEEEQNDDDEESSKSSKKAKKRKPASKKGGKKAKAAESDEKSDDEKEEEESAPKKAKKGKKSAQKDDESSDDEDSQEEFEVERIVDVYFKKNGEKEFLVRWKGFSPKDDTWEPEDNLNCKDLIAAYLKKCEEARSVTQRETRVHRKTTDRYIVNAQDTGRKLSGRHKGKPRKTYFEDND